MAKSGRKLPEGGGVWAWQVLRRVEAYETAWRAHAASPGALPAVFEPGPFPIRIQTAADLEAARFDLLAWADPGEADGPASPFWTDAPMLAGEGSAHAPPLLPMLAEAGAWLEGLRLRDGGLILKVENHDAAVQLRLADDRLLRDGGGVRLYHDWGLGLPVEIARLIDLWTVSGGPVPPKGRGRGAMNGNC